MKKFDTALRFLPRETVFPQPSCVDEPTDTWHRFPLLVLTLMTILLAGLTPASAATTAVGIVEGRVQNEASGNYLNQARISVNGTNLETFTDSIGEYRIPVPAGEVRLQISYVGMTTQLVEIRMAAGETVRRDFALALETRPGATPIVKLDAFTVVERELSSQAVALHERRNSPNIREVISLDEFGDMGQGNVGEFMKYVPGVNIDYNPQTPQAASIRGMPSTGTLVMLNGAQMGSSSDGTRTFDLGLSASGNIDRVEITKVPTPELPANAVGGTINLIPKSGFSRSMASSTISPRVFPISWSAGMGLPASATVTTPGFPPRIAREIRWIFSTAITTR